MFGFHIGETARTSAHDAPTLSSMHHVPPAAGAGGARIEPGASLPQMIAPDGPENAGTGHSVLRLRGGGGAHGKRGTDDDHRHLLGGGNRSGSYDVAGRMESHARDMNEAISAARRSALEERVRQADREMSGASDRHRQAFADKDRLKAEIDGLEREKALESPHSPRIAQIDQQLHRLDSEYRAKLELVTQYQSEITQSSLRYFDAKRELSLLSRT